MPISIRTYEKKDQDEVIEMILWSQNVEFDVPITIADQPDLLDVARFYQKNAGNFWVAVDGEKVVGSIALVDMGGGEAALRKMFVRPQYRGKEHGTAAALLGTLLAWARAHDVRTVYLGTVEALRAAHRFYAKSGFVEVQKESLPPSFPRMAVDTKFFRYDLA
jgi:N-acetylglutamate synthase-like GNAT family acetyltransferase